MARFKLVLEYDGRGFEGWQLQPGARTVQGVLTGAIERVTGDVAPQLVGSGRTDAGVHAEGQVASVEIARDITPEKLREALNGVLPPDVGVMAVEVAAPDFDARKHATGKLYRYQVWNGRVASPLRAARFAHVRARLDVAAMDEAARVFLGEHDFSSLRAAGSDVPTSVRTLDRCEVEGDAGAEIRLHVAGSGFLRHMVRNLAGTLIEVGRGRRTPESMADLLAARDRRLAGPTAPAAGLTLVSVDYDRRGDRRAGGGGGG